jgi:hypothetical protein
MSAIIDLKQNARITINKNGKRIDRTAIVSGLTGDINTLLESAIDDGDLPNYGDAYPTDSNITLNSITADPKSGGEYLIRMSYFKEDGSSSTLSGASVSVSATTASEHTDSDSSGARLESRWRDNLGAYDHATYFTAEVDRPRFTIDFEYTTATYPKTQIDTYMNRVNSVTWNGYAPKTILCSAINVNSSGAEYKVRFSFVYNEDTWQFLGSVKTIGVLLPLTAHSTAPDSDITLSTGVKAFDVYATVDFTSLGFSL